MGRRQFQKFDWLQSGLISRMGFRGAEPLLVKLLFILGGSAPKFLYQSCFSKRIDLASNVLYGIAMMNLCRCWLNYITIRLNYHVSIFKIMGVATNGPHPLSDIAPRVPFAKIFRNHPWLQYNLKWLSFQFYVKILCGGALIAGGPPVSEKFYGNMLQ